MEIRGAIVALSIIGGLSQCRIAKTDILARSTAQATEEEGPLGQSKHLAYPTRPGRLELIPEGSKASLDLAATALVDEEHREMTFPEVPQELGIKSPNLPSRK